MAYKGKYKIKDKDKYLGDISKCIYRSSWERALMHYCDTSSKVLKWGSEIVKIPYVCNTDFKIHTYIIDFIIKFKTGQWYLIEVKPNKQTMPPRNSKNKYRNLKEQFTWAKNKSKWKYAEAYAKKKGFKFQVWTEKDLKSIGLIIM